MMNPLQSEQPAVLLISGDLFLGSRIQGAVTACGASLTTAASGHAAKGRLKERSYALVLIDLETPGLAAAEIVQAANEGSPTSTVAYGPHVKERLLKSAKDAGCTEVHSRGKFDGTIREILGRYLPAGE